MTDRNATPPPGAASSKQASVRLLPVRLSGRPGGDGTFRVPSRTHPHRFYFVAWLEGGAVCGCLGWSYRRRCCHVAAVALSVQEELAA
jgi:SWIM zinc finger